MKRVSWPNLSLKIYLVTKSKKNINFRRKVARKMLTKTNTSFIELFTFNFSTRIPMFILNCPFNFIVFWLENSNEQTIGIEPTTVVIKLKMWSANVLQLKLPLCHVSFVALKKDYQVLSQAYRIQYFWVEIKNISLTITDFPFKQIPIYK